MPCPNPHNPQPCCCHDPHLRRVCCHVTAAVPYLDKLIINARDLSMALEGLFARRRCLCQACDSIHQADDHITRAQHDAPLPMSAPQYSGRFTTRSCQTRWQRLFCRLLDKDLRAVAAQVLTAIDRLADLEALQQSLDTSACEKRALLEESMEFIARADAMIRQALGGPDSSQDDN